MPYFLFSFLLLLNSCSSTVREEAPCEEVALSAPEREAPPGKPGNVIHACEGGKIQCLAERDKSGQAFIKLISLEPNTSIKFEDIQCVVDEYYLKMLMVVNTGCDASPHVEPLIIGIKPLAVDTTTLSGKVIFQGSSFQVLM